MRRGIVWKRLPQRTAPGICLDVIVLGTRDPRTGSRQPEVVGNRLTASSNRTSASAKCLNSIMTSAGPTTSAAHQGTATVLRTETETPHRVPGEPQRRAPEHRLQVVPAQTCRLWSSPITGTATSAQTLRCQIHVYYRPQSGRSCSSSANQLQLQMYKVVPYYIPQVAGRGQAASVSVPMSVKTLSGNGFPRRGGDIPWPALPQPSLGEGSRTLRKRRASQSVASRGGQGETGRRQARAVLGAVKACARALDRRTLRA